MGKNLLRRVFEKWSRYIKRVIEYLYMFFSYLSVL